MNQLDNEFILTIHVLSGKGKKLIFRKIEQLSKFCEPIPQTFHGVCNTPDQKGVLVQFTFNRTRKAKMEQQMLLVSLSLWAPWAWLTFGTQHWYSMTHQKFNLRCSFSEVSEGKITLENKIIQQ
jgi:hypothetical protein